MPATVRPPPDSRARRSPLRHSLRSRLRDDRRNPAPTQQPGVTYVPTHEGRITWDICPEPSRHLRRIDRDHPRPEQPGLRAQPQHLAEQLRQRKLVPRHKPRDRRVIRRLHHRDHLERHVLHTRPLDRPRRPYPARIRVQQQGHHRRVIRSPADAVGAIRAIELAQVQASDDVGNERREVPVRQPIPHIRR